MMVLMMAPVRRLGRWRRFKVALQTAKGFLCPRQIAGLQIAGQGLKIGVGLAVFAKRLGGRGLGTALQRLLKSRKGGLGGREIAGLQGAANGLKILD